MSASPLDLPPIHEVPAAHLSGRELGTGWTVGAIVTRDPGASGGHFSISYHVTHQDCREAFLKALNFSAAAVGPGSLVDRLNQFLAAYVFERDLLLECRDRRMSRVVKMLESGEVTVPEASPFLRSVPYLVFELADGDIRAYQAQTASFDAAWALRAMKHVLEGIEQLHAANTAHQDLKPSNVLTHAGGQEMKLGDLGRADRRSGGPWSQWPIPGAVVYAPPEQQYGSFTHTWEERRAADLYLAGSLGLQLFTGHCMSAQLQQHLPASHRLGSWTGSYAGLLPFLKSAHATVVELLDREALERIGHEDIARTFTVAIAQMTHPDPTCRGHPKDRKPRTSSFAVRRYVGVMNTLSSQARHRLVGAA